MYGWCQQSSGITPLYLKEASLIIFKILEISFFLYSLIIQDILNGAFCCPVPLTALLKIIITFEFINYWLAYQIITHANTKRPIIVISPFFLFNVLTVTRTTTLITMNFSLFHLINFIRGIVLIVVYHKI